MGRRMLKGLKAYYSQAYFYAVAGCIYEKKSHKIVDVVAC